MDSLVSNSSFEYCYLICTTEFIKEFRVYNIELLDFCQQILCINTDNCNYFWNENLQHFERKKIKKIKN